MKLTGWDSLPRKHPKKNIKTLNDKTLIKNNTTLFSLLASIKNTGTVTFAPTPGCTSTPKVLKYELVMNTFQLNITIKGKMSINLTRSVSNVVCYHRKAFFINTPDYIHKQVKAETATALPNKYLRRTHTHTEFYQSSFRSTPSWAVCVGSLKTCVLDWLLFHCAEWLSLRDLRLGNT